MIVEQVKPVQTKKGDNAEDRAPARTLGVEGVGMSLYLRVQGGGVEPVGEACQVQVAAVVSTPGLRIRRGRRDQKVRRERWGFRA